VEADTEERMAYLKHAAARRRNGEEEAEAPVELEEAVAEVTLPPERIAELEEAEEFLLTITDTGFGKRSTAYEYRVTGRGGQGIANITLTPRTGTAVAGTFPVRPGDDVMLVTDAGRLIRVPADQVRITGRAAMGVTLFRVASNEKVTSVFPIVDDGSGDEAEPPADPAGPGDAPDSRETPPGGENG
jgi:DNA gyrase subunit A